MERINNMYTLSKDSIDFIIDNETGGKAYYEKYLIHPTVPGDPDSPTNNSGITIGVGDDLGQMTKEEFLDKYGRIFPPDDEAKLLKCIGLHRDNSRAKLSTVKHIVLPWDLAQRIFVIKTVPIEVEKTEKTFGEMFHRLPEMCKSALVSIVFNRGPSMEKGQGLPSWQAIRSLVLFGTKDRWADISMYIRKMGAVSDQKGITNRRNAEAKFFQRGLDGEEGVMPSVDERVKRNAELYPLGSFDDPAIRIAQTWLNTQGEKLVVDGYRGAKTNIALAWAVERGKV